MRRWNQQHLILNFNNNMSTAIVFSDIAKTFDTTWHSDLLCQLLELEFSTRFIKLIASFPTDRKFKVGRRRIFYSKKNMGRDSSKFRPCPDIVPGTHLALFADVACTYATEEHERCALCKLRRGLTAVNSWCQRCNIKINEGKTQAIYFSRRPRARAHQGNCQTQRNRNFRETLPISGR
jgi:hypothetical protein